MGKKEKKTVAERSHERFLEKRDPVRNGTREKIKQLISQLDEIPTPWKVDSSVNQVYGGHDWMHRILDIRGWGWIQKLPNPEELQDNLTKYVAMVDPKTVGTLLKYIDELEAKLAEKNPEPKEMALPPYPENQLGEWANIIKGESNADEENGSTPPQG